MVLKGKYHTVKGLKIYLAAEGTETYPYGVSCTNRRQHGILSLKVVFLAYDCSLADKESHTRIPSGHLCILGG